MKRIVFQKWLVAIRPFSLPASTMPVLFGTVAAVVVGHATFNAPLFLLAMLGMVLLHSGANMLSDVYDYRKGLDKVPTPVSGAIVRGLITPDQGRKVSILLLVLGSLIGLMLVVLVGRPIFWIGAVGVLIGVMYTGGPVALKYHGLGDLAVFLDFGVLGTLGAWTVQTGSMSWIPVIWSVPISLLVVGILHANNWRDIAGDTDVKIVTTASTLGDHGSLLYYGIMIFGPFVLVAGLVGLGFCSDTPYAMPVNFVLTGLAFPMAVIRWRRALARRTPKQPLDFVALDGATAQLNLVFGLLCTVALLVTKVRTLFI